MENWRENVLLLMLLYGSRIQVEMSENIVRWISDGILRGVLGRILSKIFRRIPGYTSSGIVATIHGKI